MGKKWVQAQVLSSLCLTPVLHPQRGWTFSPVNKTFTFPSAAASTAAASGPAGASELGGRDGMIRTALHYANELEAIV